MKLKKISMLLIMCIMIGGCNVKDGEQMDKERYGIPVQEYTGVEYPVNEKKERWEYIKQNKEAIEAYAIEWVKETFNLDVKINNMYPTNGAAILTAEWFNDENLRIKVVIGIDEKNKRITGSNSSMDAENNIMSYISYKVYQEEFSKLDIFLGDFCKKESFYGVRDEFIYNIGAFAAMRKNHYYISTSYLDYKKTYNTFLENPSISINELKTIFEIEYQEDKEIKISKDQEYGPTLVVSLYSSSDTIDESLFQKLEKSFIEQKYLPDFNYVFLLNENNIDTRDNSSKNVSYPDAPTETGYIKVKKEVSGHD